MNGGRFDFDDGGTFCGGWEEGKAHGHGVCTGPAGQGEYAGAWHYGFEGSTYMGQWQNGKRHGLGVEQRGRWVYKGEWAQGFKGRYGRREAANSSAHYLGTWSSGLHDGYGSEIYADGGSYKGQWLRGMRHGYGIRTSAAYGIASKHRSRSNRHGSLTSLRSNNYDEYEENNLLMDTARSNKEKGLTAEEKENMEMRGGFVLKARSSAPSKRRRSLSERSLAVKRTILSNLRIKKQHSTGDIHQRVTSTAGSLRSSGSTISCTSDESDHHRHINEYEIAPEDKIESATTETYKGEWKNDARSGYGMCERSDGLRYAGEWQDNKKHGYGVTFFKDGTKEEGRYKNNVLVCSTKRRGILFVRTSKLRERVETHLDHAKRAAEIAIQRVDIALSRTMTAQERADASVEAAERARDDADTARIYAAQFDPTFHQPGIEHMRQSRGGRNALTNHIYTNHVSFESSSSAIHHPHKQQQQPQSSYHQFNHKQPHQQQKAEFYIQPNNPSLPLQQQRIADPQHQLDGGVTPTAMGSNQLLRPHNPETSSILATETQCNSARASNSAERVQFMRAGSSSQHLDNVDELSKASGSSQIPPMHQQHQQGSNSQAYSTDTTGQQPSTSKLMGNSVGPTRQQQQPKPNAVGNDSPMEGSLSPQTRALNRRTRNRPEGGSTMSLSDDHFDQYTMKRMGGIFAPPSTATAADSAIGLDDSGNSMEARLRRNRPSLIRQTEVNDAVNLNRRSTLATSRDRKTGDMTETETPAGWNNKAMPEGSSSGERGSLPNLDELISQGIYLKREEAARLASQRRQETQRLLEEEQLLAQNPLRYLYHPQFKNWLVRWKVPLLLLLGNVLLLYYLVHLLTVVDLEEDDSPQS